MAEQLCRSCFTHAEDNVKAGNTMKKIFVAISLIICLITLSCTSRQNTKQIQIPTMTSIAIETIVPTFPIDIPSVTPTPVLESNIVYNISVNPDGKMIAVTRSSGIEVYSLINGDLISSISMENLEGHHIYSYIAWSPNGKFLATGRPSSGVNILDTSSWDLLTEVKDPKEMGYQVSGFSWSPDGTQLALGMRDGTIQEWDSSKNTWTSLEKCETRQVFSLAWATNDVLQIYTNSGVYDTKTCKKVEDTKFGMDGCCGYAVLSPDNKNIFLFFDLGGNIINLQKSEYVFGICCYPTIAWSMDGRYFAATPREGNTITTFDTFDGSSFVYVIGTIQALAWSVDNELFVLSIRDGNNVIWSTRTGRTLVTLRQ